MAYAGLRRGREDSGDYWPGFVDALATLLLVAIFLISLFAVAQYALGQALSGRDEELARIQLRLTALAEALSLQEAENADLLAQKNTLIASLESANEDNERLRGDIANANASIRTLEDSLADEEELSEQARNELAALTSQIEQLNAQLTSLREALEAAEAKDASQAVQIENLSQRLNAALAQKVQELANVRSEFFETLQAALGDRADIRVVGDRFVFESDVLFDSASAELREGGKEQLRTIAAVIRDVANSIPDDVDWIIRVDGHTDVLPIRGAYKSNWHLSAERAINVVNYFEEQGVPSRRLVAAGFGEHYPIDSRRSDDAFARNRRIELKLDSR